MAAKVTLKTIADRTGLSVPTVSQILNGRNGNYSSEATRARVLKAAQELHYRSNFGYRLMQGHRTDTAAIFMSTGSVFNESKRRLLLLAMLDHLNRDGWAAYVSTFTPDEESNVELVRTMINRGVESIIICGHPVGASRIEEAIASYGVHCVGTHPVFSRCVTNGSDLGRARILDYIIAQAGNDFKVIHTPANLGAWQSHVKVLLERYPGKTLEEIAEEFLIRAPAPVPAAGNNWTQDIAANSRIAGEYAAGVMAKLLKQRHVPRAVICGSDVYALGCGKCLLAAENAKFRDRILLAGYNNDPALDHFPLPIISGEDDFTRQAQLLVTRSRDDDPCRIAVPPRIHFRKRSDSAVFPGWTDEVETLTETQYINTDMEPTF